MINDIMSNTGKYQDTIIAEIFGNIENIPVASPINIIYAYFLRKYSYLCNINNSYACQT